MSNSPRNIGQQPNFWQHKCIDGGTCHHQCPDNLSGCARQIGCAPLTDSGFDDNWNPIFTKPAEA